MKKQKKRVSFSKRVRELAKLKHPPKKHSVAWLCKQFLDEDMEILTMIEKLMREANTSATDAPLKGSRVRSKK